MKPQKSMIPFEKGDIVQVTWAITKEYIGKTGIIANVYHSDCIIVNFNTMHSGAFGAEKLKLIAKGSEHTKDIYNILNI